MKRLANIVIVFLAAFSLAGSANDGVFYAQGNNLVPLQETRVELRKELLQFYVRDFEFMDVVVDFEFFNPDGERRLTVGFVSPPAMGDVEEEGGHPQISDFTVEVNGQRLAYKVTKMSETSFATSNNSFDDWDYVYHFDVTFRPGVNRVKHTYRFRGGSSVETQRDFHYQITTGKRWANGKIGDFELQMHLDEGIYYVPASFEKAGAPAKWEIVGSGVIKPGSETILGYEDETFKMVHLNRGYLRLKEKAFEPDYEISLGEFNWVAGWAGKMCKTGSDCISESERERISMYFSLRPGQWADAEALEVLNDRERRILRNFGFALRGYEFKDSELRSYFSKFFWYKPESSVTAESVELNEVEKEFIAKLGASTK